MNFQQLSFRTQDVKSMRQFMHLHHSSYESGISFSVDVDCHFQ